MIDNIISWLNLDQYIETNEDMNNVVVLEKKMEVHYYFGKYYNQARRLHENLNKLNINNYLQVIKEKKDEFECPRTVSITAA